MQAIPEVLVSLVVALAVSPASLAQSAPAPRVVELSPAHRDSEVDAGGVKRLAVTFDRAMSTAGWSFCGGGPSFPPIPAGQKPYWKNPRTIVVPVALEPDHSYQLRLNCPSATNFRSTKGALLPSTPWAFTTLPRPAA